ncbi:alcohol dehydrogenase [Micromonospora rhizosphaerae]|uniref:Alcohol dehydrogenase n=1 Tax=Micromonospora rhizosphaerae TaxID=568872 RepID=A0A1C6T0N6_9ACTN|nr:zinc-dependent alcohol dehydrogenase family protein [Micromonospora rhizosphaerae]SCL35281.1 alcohol dehydrogenase [Micromonospora rhizosphaerae]
MKVSAAVLTTTGRSAPYGTSRPLVIEELELDPPGPAEALVRIGAAGLCHSDLSVISGVRPRPTPMVLGHEAAGVVEEVGPGVTTLRPGDHVVFSFVPVCGTCVSCQSGRPALCEQGAAANRAGTLLSGTRPFRRSDGQPVHHHLGVSGFAERTVASAASLVVVPDDVPFETAALFGCALVTGVGAVINTARAEPGCSAVVFGLGGVGLSAVMGARLAGCHPIIAVDTAPAKFEVAKRLGATEVIRAGDHAVEAIRDLTRGGAHYAFEAVGDADVLAAAYAATRPGGTTVSIGLPHPDQRLTLPALGIVAEERRLIGSYMGSAVPRRDVPRYLALYQAGRLPVDELHSRDVRLAELNSAFDALASGDVVRQTLLFEGSTTIRP